MTKPKAMSDDEWREKKRQINQEYYLKNSEHWHDYRLTNPEIERQYKAKYRNKHKDKILDYARKYRQDHRDLLREKDKIRPSHYRPRSPEQERAHSHRRRANLSKTLYNITNGDIKAILSFGCLVCDTDQNLALAHDIPVVRGGGTDVENCFCLCRFHNSQMHTRTLLEYRPDLLDKRKSQLQKIISASTL